MMAQNLGEWLINVCFNLRLIPQEGAHAPVCLDIQAQRLDSPETQGRTKYYSQKNELISNDILLYI